MIGTKYNMLTAIELHHIDSRSYQWWRFKCDCGKQTVKQLTKVKIGHTKSCGCIHEREDFTGKRFNRLVGMRFDSLAHNGTQVWLWQCDCGNTTVANTTKVKDGSTKSCGCLMKEVGERCTTHGNASGGKQTKEYQCWINLRRRCYDPNTASYPNYGGRGIKVCDSWMKSFEAFFEDMGKAPTKKHSLDRIDVDGNYCPNNCRWADYKTQANNRGNNTYLNLNGEMMTIAEAAIVFDVLPCTITSRKRRGWHDEDCVSPVKKGNYRRKT